MFHFQTQKLMAFQKVKLRHALYNLGNYKILRIPYELFIGFRSVIDCGPAYHSFCVVVTPFIFNQEACFASPKMVH
jgi:hypothetical protein